MEYAELWRKIINCIKNNFGRQKPCECEQCKNSAGIGSEVNVSLNEYEQPHVHEHVPTKTAGTTAASESALNDLLYLTLWIHGTEDAPDKPCNEVDIIEFTGAGISVEFIEFVINSSGSDLMLILNGLPTESWLKVHVLPYTEDDGSWYFEVKNYEIDKRL